MMPRMVAALMVDATVGSRVVPMARVRVTRMVPAPVLRLVTGVMPMALPVASRSCRARRPGFGLRRCDGGE